MPRNDGPRLTLAIPADVEVVAPEDPDRSRTGKILVRVEFVRVEVEFLDIDDKMNARGKYASKVKITRGLEVENYKDARFESLI